MIDQLPITTSYDDKTGVCLFQCVLADGGELHNILLLCLGERSLCGRTAERNGRYLATLPRTMNNTLRYDDRKYIHHKRSDLSGADMARAERMSILVDAAKKWRQYG